MANRYRSEDRSSYGSSSRSYSHSPPRRHDNSGTRVYIGEIGDQVSKRELRDHFEKIAPVYDLFIARYPGSFAFVQYEHSSAARRAVRELNLKPLGPYRPVVEMAVSKRNAPRRKNPPFNPNDKCFRCGQLGHYAYDCRKQMHSDFHSRRTSRSYSRSPSRSRSRISSDRRIGTTYRSRDRSPSYCSNDSYDSRNGPSRNGGRSTYTKQRDRYRRSRSKSVSSDYRANEKSRRDSGRSPRNSKYGRRSSSRSSYEVSPPKR
ncbi:hypothetical protein SNEBB_011087 [Seison nebaliae]|nr:hypothetical protein SNEBB_011087 [Seison nebaliae]